MVIFDPWRSKAFVVALGVLLAAPVSGATQHVNDRPEAEPGGGTISVETPGTPDPRL